MYDLLIKNGRIIDPAQKIDGKLDVAISGNKIVKISENIFPSSSKETIDASGKIVTPGLIDSHCHVYKKMDPEGAQPDKIGTNQGVTTVIDAGSSGASNFADLLSDMASARTSVYYLLNVCTFGQITIPELNKWQDIDLEAAHNVIKDNRDLIRGIKIRLLGKLLAQNGIEVVKIAKKLAEDFGLPLVVHIGDIEETVPATLTRETLRLLNKRDVMTHIYTASWGSCMNPDGTFIPELREAMERGVILDVGRDNIHFNLKVAINALRYGFLPGTISSDVVAHSIASVAFGLTAVISTLMELGLELPDLIAMSTVNPARNFKLDDSIGSLKPGMTADISILKLRIGKWTVVDSENKSLTLNRLLSPDSVVKSGKFYPAVDGAGEPPISN